MTREETLNKLQREKFDLLVIGGGITGAGIAYDAAMRGIRVALVEKGDFACGTSSKTARMVHGGLRYLQQFQLGLVRQSVREREILHRLAPRLIKPTAFTYPVYKRDKTSYFLVSLGMWLYDLLSFFRNYRLHRMLPSEELKILEPQIKQDGLIGAAKYYDCLVDDARFTLEIIRSAYYFGANVANYLKVTKLIKEFNRVTGAIINDMISGKEICVSSSVVVNATGVWADEIRLMDNLNELNIIRANRGTHVVLPKSKLRINSAVAFTGADGKRAMYVVPWADTCIAGTTDVDHEGDFNNVVASPEEVKFIIDSINLAFEDVKIQLSDIISTYAGLRPLLENQAESAYMISREHKIYTSSCGMITVAGGKLTTHRHMAQEVVDKVVKMLEKYSNGSGYLSSKTKDVPIAQQRLDSETEKLSELTLPLGLDSRSIQRLFCIYGPGYRHIIDLIQSNPKLGEKIVPDLPYLKAEVIYSVKYEMAMALEDIMVRRLHIFHEAQDQGLSAVQEITSLVGSYLGWDNIEIERQLKLYKEKLDQSKQYLIASKD